MKNGVNAHYLTTSTTTIDTGSIMINNKLRKNTANITLTWAMTGGNGITETSSTGYYIWAVASGSTSTFECAINQTSTNMTGNANSRLIGWFWNDTANSIEGVWYKDASERKIYESSPIPLVTMTGITINHGMGTKMLNFCGIVSTGLDSSAGINMTYSVGAAGEQIKVSDNTIAIGTEAHIGHLLSGVGYFDAGYLKLFLSTM
jgi:hypothetical protein